MGFAMTGPAGRALLDHLASGGSRDKAIGVKTAGKWASILAGALLLTAVGACSWGDPDTVYPEGGEDNRKARATAT